MRTLVLELTLDTPDLNPWPLLSCWEEDRESDTAYVIAESVRVPGRHSGLDEIIRRLTYLWRGLGPLAARGYVQRLTEDPPPRRGRS